MADPNIERADKATYSILMTYKRDESGRCSPGQDRVAADLGGLSVDTIQRSCANLERAGAIAVKRRPNKNDLIGFPGLIPEAAALRCPEVGSRSPAVSGSRTSAVSLKKNLTTTTFPNGETPTLACASDFALADASAEPPAYESPDGLVSFTAPQIEQFYVDLPGLRGKNIIGMIRHIDESYVMKGKNAAERRFALREKLLKLHTSAANGAAAKPGAKGEVASKPKKPKRVWGDDYM
jgi:hypothetical protein